MIKENNKPGLKYFHHSKLYREFLLLKKIDYMGCIEIPLDTDDNEMKLLFSDNNVQYLIERKIIVKDTQKLSLSKLGSEMLSKHYIDYQLDIIRIKKGIDNFFIDKLQFLSEKGYASIALYGAGDTARSFIEYIEWVEWIEWIGWVKCIGRIACRVIHCMFQLNWMDWMDWMD